MHIGLPHAVSNAVKQMHEKLVGVILLAFHEAG